MTDVQLPIVKVHGKERPLSTIYLSEMKIDIRPYPWWERFRVSLSVLLFGTATFRGQITDVRQTSSKP